MKTIFLISALLLSGSASFSQKVPNPGMAELSEKVISWDKMMAPKGNATGSSKNIQGRTYTAYQLALIDTFTSWIKRSYIPVGGLPQPERLALPDAVHEPPYLPQGTGVAMWMWVPCYDATGKKIIRAQPASATLVSILTNHIPGQEPASWFNTPSQYYFTMYYDKNATLLNEEDRKSNAPFINELTAKIGNYLIYFTGWRINVILMPGKQLPILQITKGELLTQGEAAVKRAFSDKKISENLVSEYLKTIQNLKEIHKEHLQDPAFINNAPLSIYSFNEGTDLFQKKSSTRYMFPVYKMEPLMYALCKQDKPQWVTISWDYADKKSKTVNLEISKAITTNFNFSYVYDYFFNPEKLNGKSYQPIKAVSQQAAMDQVEKKESVSKQGKNFPAGIYFMEDFTTTPDQTMPVGWSSSKSNRVFKITGIKNEKGKWLELDRQADIIPTSMIMPLPQNFTLDYDIATSEFTTRTGGDIMVEFADKNNETTVSFNLTPANFEYLSSYGSTAMFKIQMPRSIKYDAIYTSTYFNDFNSKNRKAHITIIKAGNSMRVLINQIQMPFLNSKKQDISQEFLLPEGTVFNSFHWKDWTDDAASKSYISNIKITKD